MSERKSIAASFIHQAAAVALSSALAVACAPAASPPPAPGEAASQLSAAAREQPGPRWGKRSLEITSGSPVQGTVGTAYQFQLDSAGGTPPVRWSIAQGALAAGLALGATSGLISGTPASAATARFTAEATDSRGETAESALTLTVVAAAPPPSPVSTLAISSGSPPAGTVGEAYQFQLQSTGGVAPVLWSLAQGVLPAGLSLTASSGAIAGTPTSAGTSSFTVQATDSTGANASSPLSITVAAASSTASSVDPTLLPVATTAQVPLTTAYDALSVPQLSAGGSYLDPTTGTKIYKLTSSTFPAASPNWGHDYSEGGDEVSLPYNGNTRTVLVRQSGSAYYLLDFNPETGIGNPRPLSGPLAPYMDLAFAFSSNPATPWYAYVSNGTAVNRIDVRTLTAAPGGGFPVTDANAVWLHQSENDSFFTWMRGATGDTVVGYQPSTGTLKTYVNAAINEPRIDRAGRYIAMTMDTPMNGLTLWDWQTNTIAWTTTGDPGIPFAHTASLRDEWIGVDWNMSYPPDFTLFTPGAPGTESHLAGPANATLVYGSGNWLQYPADPNDQWALLCHYGSLRPAQSYWLAPGGMVLITANGERRLLAHPYNTSSNYTYYSFPKFTSDGAYVLFTSDMDGSGRSDVFLAELP